MSELLFDPDASDNSETARTPLSGTRSYNEPLDADSIDEPRSSHLGCDPLDVLGVAYKHPQSEGGCHSASLNVGNDIGSCTEQANVEKSYHLVVPDVPSSLRSSVYLQRRQLRHLAAARHKASVISLSDTRNQLYTLMME